MSITSFITGLPFLNKTTVGSPPIPYLVARFGYLSQSTFTTRSESFMSTLTLSSSWLISWHGPPNVDNKTWILCSDNLHNPVVVVSHFVISLCLTQHNFKDVLIWTYTTSHKNQQGQASSHYSAYHRNSWIASFEQNTRWTVACDRFYTPLSPVTDNVDNSMRTTAHPNSFCACAHTREASFLHVCLVPNTKRRCIADDRDVPSGCSFSRRLEGDVYKMRGHRSGSCSFLTWLRSLIYTTCISNLRRFPCQLRLLNIAAVAISCLPSIATFSLHSTTTRWSMTAASIPSSWVVLEYLLAGDIYARAQEMAWARARACGREREEKEEEEGTYILIMSHSETGAEAMPREDGVAYSNTWAIFYFNNMDMGYFTDLYLRTSWSLHSHE